MTTSSPKSSGMLVFHAIYYGAMSLCFLLPFSAMHFQDTNPIKPKDAAFVIKPGGGSILGYEIGEAFDVPQCLERRSAVSGSQEYLPPSKDACFRHQVLADSGRPIAKVENVLVDQLDIRQRFGGVNAVRPLCVAVKDGRVRAVAVHIDGAGGHMDDRMRAIEQMISAMTQAVPVRISMSEVVLDRTETQTVRRWRTSGEEFALVSQVSQANFGKRVSVFRAMLIGGVPEGIADFSGALNSLKGDCPVLEEVSRL